jgi:molybdopterin molybdotransferase
MELFKVHSIEQARQKIMERFKLKEIETEEISIMETRGRISSEDVLATIDVPHFDRSTVDGYAVISKDLNGASDSMPMVLDLIGTQEMGKVNDKHLTLGQCMYVPTGGMIPEGADSVIMIEYSEMFDEESVALYKPIKPFENVMRIGDDSRKGALVLEKGRKILPKDIGVLASVGRKKLKVYAKPKVTLISTGDEIVRKIEDISPGKILDINSYAIASLLEQSGAEVIAVEYYPDIFDALKNGVMKATEKSDMVIVSGGSSMGEKDDTAKIFKEIGGDVFIHGLSIKPGKPTIVADYNGMPLIGLPGQPVSAMIVYTVIVDYILRNIHYAHGIEEQTITAKLERNLVASPGKTTYAMVRHILEDGVWKITPVYGKSGMISLISSATGYVVIPSDREGYAAGETVEFHQFI